ncbi:dinitrogenase iron-molybdenum cofactor biosynthesis protein [Orenia metallireducens]|uniref:Dinitrogenase iron-molybdenum cofactor biosynthesis protein n=1 Tax=Orenia metallireducens TaxID=1413210 RepID=A0A1C0AAD9_9FIRM|nr:dinitrogenase iron-molybdenum cofactor biosynthesis protein [Orenia metallireducens]
MKVAVSVNSNEEIISHLGKAKIFYIFSKDSEEITFIESRVTDGNHENHIIEDIKDCDVVISGKIGRGMVESLRGLGIKAIIETTTLNPVKAIAKI